MILDFFLLFIVIFLLFVFIKVYIGFDDEEG